MYTRQALYLGLLCARHCCELLATGPGSMRTLRFREVTLTKATESDGEKSQQVTAGTHNRFDGAFGSHVNFRLAETSYSGAKKGKSSATELQ